MATAGLSLIDPNARPVNMGPFAPNDPRARMGVNQYGYGTMPGQGNLGYYEQQTPAGSFAAANYARAPQQQYARQSQAQGYGPVGAQTIQGVGNIGTSGQNNPYLQQTTQRATASRNSMAGADNPYLTASINNASQDVTRNFEQSVMPQIDYREAQSGSFGHSGADRLRADAYRDLGGTLGSIATNARLQDYQQQRDLAEAQANRETQTSQYNSGLMAGDLNRQTNAYLQGAGLDQQARMFDASNQLGTQQFNSNAANQMGMFNAGQGNQLSMFNAGQGNQTSQFNAGQGNQLGQYMAGLGQNVNLANVGAANNMLQQQRSLGQQQNQFDRQFDYTAGRNAIFDPMSLAQQQMNLNTQGFNLAQMEQNAPLQYLTQLFGLANQTGGMGGTGTNSQPLQGNPLLGGIGGALTVQQLLQQLYGNGS